MASRRPLPTPPAPPLGFKYNQYTLSRPTDMYPPGNPYYSPYYNPDTYGEPTTTLPGGTLLHKGFYDLLSMIPTPSSPSRLLQQWMAQAPEPVVAGPRYEHIGSGPMPANKPVQSPPVSPKKGRRISKDMVSRPTGFVHLVHASDADQAEALLTRWGPDGLGKLGDPRWANPIKNRIRYNNDVRPVNEVVSPVQPSQSTSKIIDAGALGPLRVVNGMSTTTTSTLTTAARENVSVSPAEGLPGRPGNSTIRWGGDLVTHLEEQHEHDLLPVKDLPETPPVPKPITPSLATLEKAVSARIYFENLYFPLFRHTPSREQRRLAMERDMMDMQLGSAQKENLRARWRQNETDYLREKRQKVDVTAFTILKTIGHGAFGVVSLVKERSTGQLYAMKQLRKTDMLRKGQEGHVRAERDILKSASLVASPGGAEWIVRLHYSFQDRDNLYLVLEYMGGGDLLNLLIERDIFEEEFTRFYVAEMVLAIESCHKHGFIHRDIKPDNFLFDPEGHIKLSDFGLATDLHWAHDTSYYEQQRLHLLHKHGIDLEDTNGIADGRKTKRMNRKDVELLMGGEGEGGLFTWREKNRRKLAYSVCGTNSYMSPEVIRGHGYSYSCDWWSLGVIMYECLYGRPPFVSNSRHITRQKILNWKQTLRFPSRPRVSREGVDLMTQLLCEPEDRLGSQASASVSRPNSLVVQARRSGFMSVSGDVDGADHIKAHPWFRGIDWANIHRYQAPYLPELRYPEDTRHFEDDIPAEPLEPANGAPADATRDPLLRHEVHGAEILDVRKALAFAGFTHKSPRAISYVRADKAFYPQPDTYGQEPTRGRSTLPQQTVGRGRAISM
ncbi:kinase-like protein [Desarmillaria tabescens]|uniref:non-specific serine/threonine protein kinase n=1 Tax=Armillaria tabescens TaxID=1929756 RepID=A0AA39N935_ARMTA|nr:kinase-like protein [Desarmillaria tabescens]KAK0461301.1 kinase-like protein [Desarmillaria tabescens]